MLGLWGPSFSKSLRELNVGEVRGRRLLIGVGLESAELAEDVVNQMRDAGVLLNRAPPWGCAEDPPTTWLL